MGSLSSLGGIGVMVKEITEDEENDRQDDDDSMSGKSSDIHNIPSLYHCDCTPLMTYDILKICTHFKFLLYDFSK